MKHKTIITIGRQFGSGGREIAKALSEALSIPLYDKEIIAEAAKKSGLHENIFKHADERKTSSFLYSLALGVYSPPVGNAGMPMINMDETIFQVQSDIIREFAEKGPCVFVGRCADYILRKQPDLCRIFLYGSMEKRVERVSGLYHIDVEKAEELIQKTDRKRANFYHYYTGERWNDMRNYDLCLNSGDIGVYGSVEMILSYIKLREKQ
ncbi:MAG: cytidylate kinase-like family protein [Ruminococcaceae bacterium]|nr:cytidylate kinase-like family protein [Oscillospiraceae bacterium]